MRSGYEVQLERTQHLCDLAVSRANKRAEAAEVAATGRARRAGEPTKKNAKGDRARAPRLDGAENDPWSFLGDGAREKARALAGPESAERAARERAALEAADARIQKVDAYYARVKKRGEADAARTAETRAEFREARRDASDSVSSSSRRASGDDARRVRGGGGGDGVGLSDSRETFRDQAVAAAAAVLVQGAVARVVGRNQVPVETRATPDERRDDDVE